MAKKLVPFQLVTTELVVVNSRFITSLSAVGSVEEARKFIKQMKEKHSDASHNVPAYIIGHGQSQIAHCSDDGEPSGTAGRPALAVLQGSGLGDVVVVVTRYFGGTKLGKGGLVRAYGDAVREALQKTIFAEIIQTDLIQIEIGYPYFEQTRRLLIRYLADIEKEEFSDKVIIQARIPSEEFENIQREILDLSSGQASVDALLSKQDTRRPVRL